MGRLILVSGANDSGKSRWAERYLSGYPGEKYYIATMVPETEETRRRIEKHRRQRAGLGFHTLELPEDVENAPVSPNSAVLLEDVSNLLGNARFQSGKGWEAVGAALIALRARTALLCAVTISGLTEEGYEGETAEYIRELNLLNAFLTAASDSAVSMENGDPQVVKGEPYALF